MLSSQRELAQPPELLALGGGQAIALTAVALCLSDPTADDALGEVQVTTHLWDRLARAADLPDGLGLALAC